MKGIFRLYKEKLKGSYLRHVRPAHTREVAGGKVRDRLVRCEDGWNDVHAGPAPCDLCGLEEPPRKPRQVSSSEGCADRPWAEPCAGLALRAGPSQAFLF